MAASPIALENLTHSYGDRRALDDLSFGVREREIFGLLGPNGSGKTTLFRILSTLMTPSAGHAAIAGFDVAARPNEVRSRIGIVFQARSVDLKLTVRENLMHAGHLYGLRGKELQARIDAVLDRVALRDRANAFVETLSGGMQRRVELAKGLLHAPSILLLDEPSTGLDPGARRDLWQYLRALRDADGISVLVTTHLMEEAELCDRLAILSGGKLVALGSPAELRSGLGGSVITLTTRSAAEAQRLSAALRSRFELAGAVMGESVRLQHAEGNRFASAAAEAFPDLVEGTSVQKPSLEDVFIERTGHRFWHEREPSPKALMESQRLESLQHPV